MASRSLFVQGVKHSGTTILYRMLAHHPDTTWFSQYSLRDGAIPGRRKIVAGNWVDTTLRRRTVFSWAKERHRFDQLLTPRPGEAPTVFDYLAPVAWQGRIRTSEMLEAFERFRTLQDRRCLIVKLPRLWDRAEAISRMAPDTRQLHIIREPFAASLSLRESFRGDDSDGDALRRAAHYWRRATQAMEQEERRSGRVLRVAYEAFCENTHEQLDRCLRFSGLDPSTYPFSRVPAQLASSNVRWYSMMSIEDRSILEGEFPDHPLMDS